MSEPSKVCTKCEKELGLSSYWKCAGHKDGLAYWCKDCSRKNIKKWKEAHPNYDVEYSKRYHKERPNASKENHRRYNEKYPGKHAQDQLKWTDRNPNYDKVYKKNKYYEDVQFRVAVNLRNRIRNAIRRQANKDGACVQKPGSAWSDLGCDWPTYKAWMEAKFQPEWTWTGPGRKLWHIDHVVPLASFDLTNREQFLKAVHYTNQQPLLGKDNLTKYTKLNWSKK